MGKQVALEKVSYTSYMRIHYPSMLCSKLHSKLETDVFNQLLLKAYGNGTTTWHVCCLNLRLVEVYSIRCIMSEFAKYAINSFPLLSSAATLHPKHSINADSMVASCQEASGSKTAGPEMQCECA